jgi:hypothetical protein
LPKPSDFVVLPGLCVPVASLRLLLDLEQRGFTLAGFGDDILVRPAANLTDDDRLQLRRWKRHVRALLDYEPPAVQ